MPILFTNPGLLDIRAATTFGVNVKPASDSPIGFFGTGLKYAIAVLLREGQSIEILSGETHYKFIPELESIRGKDFLTIALLENGGAPTRLGWTTELGKNWALWQAYREIYCNALDEGGQVASAKSLPESAHADSTIIAISGEAFAQLHARRFDFLLDPERKPWLTGQGLEVHPGKTKSLFYRGIKVHEFQKETLFTYNITYPLSLTEDRTPSYTWELPNRLRDGIVTISEESFLTSVLCCPKGAFEFDLQFTGLPSANPAFTRIARELCKTSPARMNPSIRVAVIAEDRKALRGKPATLTRVQQTMLAKAQTFVARLVPDLGDYPIICSQGMGDLMGAAYQGQILIAPAAFECGTKQLAGTILEEYFHLAKNVEDETRGFQELLLMKIISLGEELQGEPL